MINIEKILRNRVCYIEIKVGHETIGIYITVWSTAFVVANIIANKDGRLRIVVEVRGINYVNHFSYKEAIVVNVGLKMGKIISNFSKEVVFIVY